MKEKQPVVLVLGAGGMLGRVVYRYLSDIQQLSVLGTHHQPKLPLVMFGAETKEADLASLSVTVGRFDWVINCIGQLRASQAGWRELQRVNSLLPKWLEKEAGRQKFRLIQISSDAVFAAHAGGVTELFSPGPEDDYGRSKLDGETSSPWALTIRTSIIGFDPDHGRGLVEWVRQSHGTIDGYTNQQWSGATVLQLAKLIHWLIQKDGFEKIRKKTPVLHFAPMGPTTKAELVKQIALSLRLSHLKVRPVAGQTTVTRYLDSRYVNEIPQIIIGDKIAPALRELINFEKSKG